MADLHRPRAPAPGHEAYSSVTNSFVLVTAVALTPASVTNLTIASAQVWRRQRRTKPSAPLATPNIPRGVPGYSASCHAPIRAIGRGDRLPSADQDGCSRSVFS